LFILTVSAINLNKVKEIIYNTYMNYVVLFDFYMFYIWMFFLLGFNNIFTSYSIAIWYFTKKKDTVLVII